MQLNAVYAYAKTVPQGTRKGCHLHVADAIDHASSVQDITTLGSLVPLVESRHDGLGVAGPTRMHEVRHIDHYICTRTKSSTHMVYSSSSNAVMVMAGTAGTAGIMLELYWREVLLFLDVVSIDTCNRNGKMQESQTRGGGECRLGFVVDCARTGLVTHTHTHTQATRRGSKTIEQCFVFECRQHEMEKIRMRLTVRQM